MVTQVDAEQLEQAVTDCAAAGSLTRDDVEAILREYGDYIGVDDLVLDENGSTALSIENKIDIALIHLPQFPGIVAAVEMDPDVRENPRLLRRLLQANMSWQWTQGGCFSVIPSNNTLVLCRLIQTIDRDLKKMDQEISTFVELSRQWKNELDEELLLDEDDNEPISLEFRSGFIRC